MTTGRMQFLSQSMNRLADFSFILADKAMPEKGPAKNLYLLHGLTGTDTDWLWGGGNAHQIAKEFHLNIFMPTCGNTFYLDLPGNGNAYGSYIGKEFVRYTQQIFHLSSAREDNLIGGFSMGGYGALHAALSYPDSFSRAAVLSAASPREALSYLKPSGVSSVADPTAEAECLLRRGVALPKLYMACGTEDSLLPASREYQTFFSAHMDDFLYEEGPGMHDWSFWNLYVLRGLRWLLGGL